VRVTPLKPALPTPSPVSSSRTDPDTALRGTGVGPGVGVATGQGDGTSVVADNAQRSVTAWTGATLTQEANKKRANQVRPCSFWVKVLATQSMTWLGFAFNLIKSVQISSAQFNSIRIKSNQIKSNQFLCPSNDDKDFQEKSNF
jgi:hypothetical protein